MAFRDKNDIRGKSEYDYQDQLLRSKPVIVVVIFTVASSIIGVKLSIKILALPLFHYIWNVDTIPTSLGLVWSSLSPCPSLPYRPFPQVYTSPLAVMHALCAPPAEMSETSLPRNDSMMRGRSHGLKYKQRQFYHRDLGLYSMHGAIPALTKPNPNINHTASHT